VRDDHIISVCVGMTGSGKSTRAATLVRDLPRVLYYDTLGHDYSDGVVFDDAADLVKFWRGVYRDRFRLVYRPADPQRDFPLICDLVYECGSMGFVAEEADLFCRNGRVRDEAFQRLIGKGRHRDIDLVCVTQAPKRIADFLRSQAHDWYIFMVKEPPHVEYLRDRCSGLVTAEQIMGLPRYHYLHYSDYGADDAPEAHRCLDNLVTGATRRERLAGDERQTDPDPAQHDVAR
jgi:hypothetical protein